MTKIVIRCASNATHHDAPSAARRARRLAYGNVGKRMSIPERRSSYSAGLRPGLFFLKLDRS